MKYIAIFLAVFGAMCAGCTTNTTDSSVMLGAEGESRVVIGDLQASKADIRSVLFKILRERRWTVLDEGNPIVAERLSGKQHAKVSIYVNSGSIVADCAGSTRGGEAYVPLSFLEYLRQSLVRDLRMGEYERYNKISK